MKYSKMVKQSDVSIGGFFYADGSKMIAEIKKPCRICGDLTAVIDVRLEDYVCSEECMYKSEELESGNSIS